MSEKLFAETVVVCIFIFADMAELADALDLGSSSSECRFDSCYPHGKSRRAAILVGFRLLFLGSGNKMVIFFLNS